MRSHVGTALKPLRAMQTRQAYEETLARYSHWADMPLFYLDFQVEHVFARDNAGHWFPDLDAARREATQLAAHITRDTGAEYVTVTIRDQDGRRLGEEPDGATIPIAPASKR